MATTNDVACLEYIKNKRWPNGIHCKNCGKVTKHHFLAGRKSYCCQFCGNNVHPTARTIFHKSETQLIKWFYAIYLMAQTRGGISAKQLQRELGVTYKTAWRMFKLIRSRLDEDNDPFSGDVEMDETYIGGKRRGKRGRGAEGKTPVVGMVQRKGQIKAVSVPDVKSETINALVKENIEPGTMVHTDEFSVYNKLERMGYEHRRIAHSAKIYVVGNVHTNTIEGFWALVKNGIVGVYHHCSSTYLQSYLNEYAFRYNHRNDITPMFLTFLHRMAMEVA
jgi:transposase-like protein